MTRSINIHSVFDVFCDPLVIGHYSEQQWQDMIRVLRGGDLLGAFYYLLDESSLISSVPDFFLKHIESAKIYADRQSHQIQSEAKDLDHLLKSLAIRPIFLKGAAYVLNSDRNHLGRIMSDIDILVPKTELEKVEKLLQKNDWVVKQLDDYDDQYYRKWAHEIPPYTHLFRGTTLDVHHTLLPPISGHLISEDILFNFVQSTSTNALVLKDELKVLHSIIHLFFNEDFEKSFRDLLDIHLLLNELESRCSLDKFYSLAVSLRFQKEIYYVIKLRELIFRRVFTEEEEQLINAWPFVRRANVFIHLILYWSFIPSHDLISSRWIHFAKFIMYLRGHLLKMPLRILVPHFIVKTKRALVMSIYGAHHYEK